MLANLPHVLARFGGAGEPALAGPEGGGNAPPQASPPAPQPQQQQQRQGAEEEALFLLDSGAGGVEVMFHWRAVEELALRSLPQVRTHSLKVCPPDDGGTTLTRPRAALCPSSRRASLHLSLLRSIAVLVDG